ncbi:MAG: glycoside hydrolase family 95 protein [Phycisphaerales bacterium]|nr:MAG: glycoside hydrolase family 95 protein [Phycisphaerales bacterium]
MFIAHSSIAVVLIAAACAWGQPGDEPHDLTLWYRQPASQWVEALPVGNGRLGAMVFGGVSEARIQLNEDTLWAGPPVSENPPGMAADLAEARRLFFAGKPDEGQQLVQDRMMAPRISPRSHQTLGDLTLHMIYGDRRRAEPVSIEQWRRGPVAEGHDELQLLQDFDDSAWPSVADDSDLAIPEHSTVVFRAAFELHEDQISAGLSRLELSPIDDASIIYLNGRKIGETVQWHQPHAFNVDGVLHPGENVLAVAARNVGGPGNMARSVRLVAADTAEAYRRSLDLTTAIASTQYEIDGITYRREVFASPVDDVLIVHIAASEPGKISFDATLDRPADFQTRVQGDNCLIMHGQATQNGEHNGVKYHAVLAAGLEGGTIHAEDASLKVRDADTATLLLAAATDYNFADPASPLMRNRLEACERIIVAAGVKSFEQLRRDHITAHRRLFDRVSLDLGPGPDPDSPTDARLQNVIEGGTDPNLEALYFQYGRYLLICSSRPGTMPANLQGLWNEHLEAPWNADYHLNINIQMNYWPAEVTNLSECHLPLFDLMEGMMPDGRDLARKLGCRGVAFGHVSDAWLWAAVQGQAVWGMWPMGAGWLSAHLMEHYHFTGDAAFLRDRAYPFLTETATFYLDWLVEDPETGLLVSGPTTSPENTYWLDEKRLSLSMGTSMDQQIIWETFTNTLRAAKLLNIDDEFTEQVASSLSRLSPPRIGSDGRLMEWAREYRDAEPGHRHMSHLYGLHPGFQISVTKTPKLAVAARKTLDARLAHGGGHTGWSRAWLVNFAARFRDGEFAHDNLRLLLGKSTLPNLFDNHPPFQIDGNFGGCAGIAEMLLQSHAGEIHLLPALPDAWPAGRVTGLCARGGFVVDIEWADGRLRQATIHSKLGNSCIVRYGVQTLERETEPGGAYPLTPDSFAD